ncbi:AraC-like DNA-binding protein [Larkinella arboricola]|uniref:AraC-like DNA-binding protein n=1 Tax=Larkinella arboricola TaxID=643671 RepID=A0A327WR32_LARAB|nr:helix-turn-helix domain-containing protein [Larkinella arboricola]RAJ91019.1 AraC-like DNA-binding protein [Larkinella arboricola]
MRYQNFPPSAGLQDYIEEYTLLSSADPIKSEGLPPGGRSGLIINLGTECRFTFSGTTCGLPPVAIGGQMTHQMQLTPQAGCQLLMITFRTTAFYRLFGLPMAELADQVLDIEAVFPLTFRQQWRAIMDQLRTLETIQECIQLIEKGLLAYVHRMPYFSANWVDQAATWLAQPGSRRIGNLSQEARISTRSLTREFSRQVGITPKSFAQVMRFRNMFRVVMSQPKPCWQDLVYYGGWYDQAHFCNDLLQITGLTPTDFFAQQHATTGLLISNPDQLS